MSDENQHHLQFGRSTMTVGEAPIGVSAQAQPQGQQAQAQLGQGAIVVQPNGQQQVAQQPVLQQPVVQTPVAQAQQAPSQMQIISVPGQQPGLPQLPQAPVSPEQAFADALSLHRDILDQVRALAGLQPNVGLWNVPGLEAYRPSNEAVVDVMSLFVSPVGMIGNELDLERLKADAERSSGWGVIKTADPNAPLNTAEVPSAFLTWAVYQTPPLISALFILNQTNPTLVQQAIQALGVSPEQLVQTFTLLDNEFATRAQAAGEYWALINRLSTGTLTEDVHQHLTAGTTQGWGWGWGWNWTSRQKLYGAR